jgi:hypothetical protein
MAVSINGTTGLIDANVSGTIQAGSVVTGNVIGDLTGNVTGNITGNLTGDVAAQNIQTTLLTAINNFYKVTPSIGALSGPNLWISAYKTRFAKQWGYGPDLNPYSTNDGILVLRTGYYHVRAVQRIGTAGTNSFITVAVNGNRSTLETRADGIFNHSHGQGSAIYTESNFYGQLITGELITMGASTTTNRDLLIYGNDGYVGSLTIIPL